VIVELHGVELFGYHGVNESEKQNGQPFLYDVWLDVGARGADDRIDNAVDYRRVAEALSEVNSEPVDLLEALATRTADLLLARFRLSWVKVRVRKPQVQPAGLTVEYSAVTVERRPE